MTAVSSLMGFLPILADPDLHPKRHGQCCGFGHERLDLPTYFFHRGLGYFEDKLIMDLHNELGVDTALDVPTVYADHRPLDDIGRRALHRHIRSGGCSVVRCMAQVLLTSGSGRQPCEM